ncbi:MAG: MFS transporter [Burkholderiaceae bacterium]
MPCGYLSGWAPVKPITDNPNAAPEPEPEPPKPPEPPDAGGLRWAMLAGVWLIYCAFGLVAASLAPLVALVVRDLQLSHAAMGSILGAWQLVYIASAIPCGMLLDRLGPRRALAIGALLIAASGFARSLAVDYTDLLVAVMIFGLGGPIVSAGAPKVIAQWFAGKDRGLAMGIYITGPSIGGVVSLTLTHPVLLPAFDGNWRGVIGLWAGFSVLAAITWFVIASHRDARAMENAEQQQIRPPQLATMKLLLREPAVRIVMLMSVGVFLINHGLNNWLPELLRNGGMTLVQSGLWAAIPTVVGIAASLVIPRLATPGRRFQILFWLCVMSACATVLLQTISPLPLTVGLLMQGIARSTMMTVLILTLVELPGIGRQHAGTAGGLFFSAAEVGGVLGPLSLGVLYDYTGNFSLGLMMFTVAAIALAITTRRLQTRVGTDKPAA